MAANRAKVAMRRGCLRAILYEPFCAWLSVVFFILQWDFTRAPFHWTDSIIRLNFNCTINFHIKEKRCVLIKLKGLSNCKWCQSRMCLKIYETLSSMGIDGASTFALHSLRHLPIRCFNHTFSFQLLPPTMTFLFDPLFHLCSRIIVPHQLFQFITEEPHNSKMSI
jgi:hypothetical protein